MIKSERTLVVIKHDAVMRGLIGEVIQRLERVGLKLVALEFLSATEDMGDKHYASSDENLKRFGNNTLGMCKEQGVDPKEKYGTEDPLEIGRMVKRWNVELITRGPVLAMIWEGPDAVNIVRKLAGPTNPQIAPPGTIRGDYSWDNFEVANDELRSVYNVLHASGNVKEAEMEIKLWFSENEIFPAYELYAHRAMRKMK
ncbi:MAG: nucleoside-diphosphate kinase [Candidatus Dojkabacteria bacterium]|nr:nucleoside-diphosphate kinase [Candidatus Dojkabacteria bacterium]